MKKIISAAIFVFCSSQALAQSAPVFSPHGEYLGHAVKNGNKTIFVDKNGKYGGAHIQHQNGTASVLDKNGNHNLPRRIGAAVPSMAGMAMAVTGIDRRLRLRVMAMGIVHHRRSHMDTATGRRSPVAMTTGSGISSDYLRKLRGDPNVPPLSLFVAFCNL